MKPTPLIDNLNNAVRENPVAAGLIGLGLAWMVFGRSGPVVGQGGVMRGAKRAIDATLDTAAGAVSGAADQAQKAASTATDTLRRGVEGVSSKIGDAVEGMKPSQRAPEHQSEFQRHFSAPSESQFSNLLNRQPLALAAVGVAIGAGLACAFPSTRIEEQVIGDTGAKIKETMADATDTIVERAGAAIDEAVDEAVAQDLTPEAVKDMVRKGTEKVKAVADAGLESLKR